MQLLENLNKVNSINFEIDLGFQKIEFMSSYRKRFVVKSFQKCIVEMFYTEEELNLFETFFVETLNYGTLSFEADFFNNSEIKTYDITKEPEINHIEADLYSVKLNLIENNSIADITKITLNSCLNNMFNSLNNINTSVSNNTWASIEKKQLATCLINHFNLINENINCYVEKNHITDSDII